MKVLIIKMSSLGDVLHTFPALTDAVQYCPGIQFDWVVEEAFADLVESHPLVNQAFPIALRRWRKTPVRSFFGVEWRSFIKKLRQEHYDLVIDAQGLIKSAFIGLWARGPKAGLDRSSIWEKSAAWFYQKTYSVNPNQHAIARVRQLFAKALGYVFVDTPPVYGLNRSELAKKNPLRSIQKSLDGQYILFLHSTTWATKLWPVNYWIQLAKELEKSGESILLPWGNVLEKKRAELIAGEASCATVLPKYSVAEMMAIIAGAKAIVSVDTGLGHVAAALGVPTVSLYGPTDPELTGACGENQYWIKADFPCSPCLRRECTYQGESVEKPACFTTVLPERVYEALKSMLGVYQ